MISPGGQRSVDLIFTGCRLLELQGLAQVRSPFRSGTRDIYVGRGLVYMTRNINITRALGVDNPPADVYITGTATEGGSDLSKALKFQQTAYGKYEIYTSLA